MTTLEYIFVGILLVTIWLYASAIIVALSVRLPDSDPLPCGHSVTSLVTVDGVEFCHACEEHFFWELLQILNAPHDNKENHIITSPYQLDGHAATMGKDGKG